MEHKERCKKYYREHKEYFREYNAKHYNSEYFKEYYKAHKETILKQTKKNTQKRKGNYVYFLLDNDKNAIYIGSTTNIKTRFSNQFTGNSNLHMTYSELVDRYDLKEIVYKDFSNVDMNRSELFYLEYLCKNELKEIIKGNKISIDFDKISDERKEELKQLLINSEIKVFDDTKYKKVS